MFTESPVTIEPMAHSIFSFSVEEYKVPTSSSHASVGPSFNVYDSFLDT